MLQARKQEYGTHHRSPNSQGIMELAMEECRRDISQKEAGDEKRNSLLGKETLQR